MKKGDFIILALVLLLCAVSLLILLPGKAELVVVEMNGTEIYRGPLSIDARIPAGGNVIEIKNGQAFMTDADCPDKLCIRMGNATTLKPVVCLPNKVTIRLVGGEENIDAISY